MENNFHTWIDTFIDEKNIDVEQVLEINGNSGMNYIPLNCLIDAIKNTSNNEQNNIKSMLVKIDFYHKDVIHYFKHLAQAIAI